MEFAVVNNYMGPVATKVMKGYSEEDIRGGDEFKVIYSVQFKPHYKNNRKIVVYSINNNLNVFYKSIVDKRRYLNNTTILDDLFSLILNEIRNVTLLTVALVSIENCFNKHVQKM